MSDEMTSAVGHRLYPEATGEVRCHGRAFTVIGCLHSPDEFLIGVDATDGSVWVVASDLQAAWPLNASRSGLEACIAAFDRYVEDGPADSGPTVYSAGEMRERLELLAKGELAPRPPRKPAVSHRRRFARLRKDFRAADTSALAPASWWAATLEEAKHDLI